MKREIEDISTTTKGLQVEVPADAVKEKIGETLDTMGKTLSIPGFRPGKAPKSMLMARFKKEIKDEVVRELAPEYINKALEEENLEPVTEPKVEDVDFQDGEPLKLKATFEVVPDFELPQYKGLELAKTVPALEEGEVNTILTRMQDEESTWEPDESRAAAEGDLVTIDLQYRFKKEDREALDHKDIPYVVGDSNLPETVVETLKGLGRGVSKETDAFVFPEDWYDKTLATQEVVASITVKEVKVKNTPELDDELALQLAKRFGKKDVNNLDQFKKVVEADVIEEKEAQAKRGLSDKVLESIIDGLDFDLPPSLVEEEVQHRLEDIAMSLDARGFDLQNQQLDWKKIREDQQEGAVKTVRQQLAARRIAGEEDLKITDSVLDEKLLEYARSNNERLEDLKERLAEDGRLDRIRRQMQVDAVVDFVLGNATIKEEA